MNEFRTTERDRIEALNEALSGKEHINEEVIQESTAEKDSVYGIAGAGLMKVLIKILKKHVPAKYIKFKEEGVSRGGIVVISFNGYNRSDFEVKGSVVAYDIKGKWRVELEYNSPMRGKAEEKWEFVQSEDVKIPFTNCAKTLKAWVEVGG